MKERISKFFLGRNGMDELNRFMNITALVLLALGIFVRLFSSLGMAVFILTVYRTMSRNLYKRSQENDGYLQIKGRVKSWIAIQKKRFAERKTHCYFRCPSCKQTVRVPKGKGKISIICPKCGTAFVEKS